MLLLQYSVGRFSQFPPEIGIQVAKVGKKYLRTKQVMKKGHSNKTLSHNNSECLLRSLKKKMAIRFESLKKWWRIDKKGTLLVISHDIWAGLPAECERTQEIGVEKEVWCCFWRRRLILYRIDVKSQWFKYLSGFKKYSRRMLWIMFLSNKRWRCHWHKAPISQSSKEKAREESWGHRIGFSVERYCRWLSWKVFSF